MKLLILGAAGQVGRELRRLAWPQGWRSAWFDRADFDIADANAMADAFAREAPDIVINAAAYTAVDRAESEADATWAANATAPGLLAAACARRGARLVHLSTDYVFDGTKAAAYGEDEPVNPLGVYGRSKAAGEAAVRDVLPEHVTIRTAWLYSAHGQNFVRTMLRLAQERPSLRVVADQHGTPTSAADIAAAILVVARQIGAGQGVWGTFHLTGAGPTTWHGFAEAIVALSAPYTGKSPPVEPIATADYPTPARRPANSVLDCRRIAAAYGVAARPWREALVPVIAELFDKTA